MIKPEDQIIIDENLRKSEELVATSKVKVTPEIVYGYINKYKDIAMNNMKTMVFRQVFHWRKPF